MKTRRPDRKPADSSRRGAVMVFMAVGIMMLLSMVMIMVDVASMQLARTELRAATDAAAKAGAESLIRTQDQAKAVQAAKDIALLNFVGGKPFKIRTSNVVVGTSSVQSDGSWAFTAGGAKPNAVRINSLMNDSSASGSITLAFGKVFNTGSFTPSKTSTASAIRQEICLAIDRSGSMAWDLSGYSGSYPSGGDDDRRPASGSRWASLRKAVDIFLDEVSSTVLPSRVALVTWASAESDPDTADNYGLPWPTTPTPNYNTAQIESALSYDFSSLKYRMKQRSEHPLYGRTNMSAGIDTSVGVLTATNVQPYANKVMVLMTDGQWNEGRNPRDAAADARNKGIVIHVVTFLPEASTADAQAVASITGGTYIHASNESELIAAFEKLARTLPVVLTD